jgi:hypothetical protein
MRGANREDFRGSSVRGLRGAGDSGQQRPVQEGGGGGGGDKRTEVELILW